MLSTQTNSYNNSLRNHINGSSPTTLKRLSETGKLSEREEIVREALQSTCIPLAKDCLNEYMNKIHERSSTQILQLINRLENLYNQLFAPLSGLNTSFTRSPTFLNDVQDIQEALVKVDRLYCAYRDSCIQEAIKAMPSYFIKKLSLKTEDENIVKKQFYPAIKAIKETFLDSEFATFHQSTTLSYIHYFLRIPPEASGAYTSWAIEDMRKTHLLETKETN